MAVNFDFALLWASEYPPQEKLRPLEPTVGFLVFFRGILVLRSNGVDGLKVSIRPLIVRCLQKKNLWLNDISVRC